MNIANIKGLNTYGISVIGKLFEHYQHEYIEPNFHPSVKGAWFQVYNVHTQDVVILDGNTTIETLLQVLNRKGAE